MEILLIYGNFHIIYTYAVILWRESICIIWRREDFIKSFAQWLDINVEHNYYIANMIK